VLHIEALIPAFGAAIWTFVKRGAYEIRQASETGKPVLYRFPKPSSSEFPAMIELFCRAPTLDRRRTTDSPERTRVARPHRTQGSRRGSRRKKYSQAWERRDPADAAAFPGRATPPGSQNRAGSRDVPDSLGGRRDLRSQTGPRRTATCSSSRAASASLSAPVMDQRPECSDSYRRFIHIAAIDAPAARKSKFSAR
jgi:hypothetical protein